MEALNDVVAQLFPVKLLTVCSDGARQFLDGHNNPSITSIFEHFPYLNGLQVSFRDSCSNLIHTIDKMYFNFADLVDIERDTENISGQTRLKLLSAVSSHINKNEYFEQNCTDTPWFDDWKKVFLNNFEPQDHEFIGSFFGTIFILTTSDLEQFRDVIADLHTNVKQAKKVRWYCPNFLKYFIVIDSSKPSGDVVAASNDKFQELSSIYGNGHCVYLQINETNDFIRHPIEPELNQSVSHQNEIIDNHIPYNSQFGPLALRVESIPGTEMMPETPPPIVTSEPIARNAFSISFRLRENVEILLKELVSKALIPWSERQLRVLNESISLRKGLRRSLFSATKQLFVMSSSTVNLKGPNTTPGPVYSLESNEMQQRKVADLCMCLSLYELAHSFYYSAKKDFQLEGASLYAAGASEALAIAAILINKPQKHYFDDAITTYMDVCRNVDLATRATLFATDAMRTLWPNEAANLFIRMTSEDSDLRSALFLEQAAICFLKSGAPRTRKASFHYVLAGHRYNKCGLKRHALASYSKFSSTRGLTPLTT